MPQAYCYRSREGCATSIVSAYFPLRRDNLIVIITFRHRKNKSLSSGLIVSWTRLFVLLSCALQKVGLVVFGSTTTTLR